MINLYIINFLLAASTTIGMTIIPLLSVEIIGISLFLFALIEGVGEFSSNIIKLISGYLFDKLKNKKRLFFIAIILAFFSKLLLIIPNIYTLISTKFLERLSNGFFASPRDAFVGVMSGDKKGLSLGILNSSRALGCVFGSIVTSFYLSKELSFPLIANLIIFATLLCFVSFILSCFMKDFTKKIIKKETAKYSSIQVVKDNYELYLIVFLFFCARFNDGLIILFLKQNSIEPWFYLSAIGIFNSISFLIAPFLGMILDSKYKKIAVYITFFSLIIFNIIFIFCKTLDLKMAFLALFFWGAQRVGSQVCFTKLLFNNVSKEKYGTACGAMNLFVGFGSLIAALIGGYLISYNFSYVFIFSLLLTSISLLFFYKKYKVINDPKHF
jgi:MFS family permease